MCMYVYLYIYRERETEREDIEKVIEVALLDDDIWSTVKEFAVVLSKKEWRPRACHDVLPDIPGIMI